MNVAEEVRSRRLTTVLAEALGDGVPPDLEQRVLQCVRGVEVAPRRLSPIVAAITLLAGVLVVCLVAWSRSSHDDAATLQDPQRADAPVVIDLASLPPGDAAKGIDAAAGDAVVRTFGIARGVGADIVIAGAIEGESRVALAGRSWREAIEAIAVERQVGLAEFGSTVLLGGGQVPAPRARATFDTDVIRAVDALKVLHARGGLNLVVAGERLGGRVRMDVRDRPWRTVLDAVAAAAGAKIVGRGNVFAMVRDEAARPAGAKVENRVGAYEFTRPMPFGDAIGMWVRTTSTNVVVDARIDASIHRFAYGVGAGPEPFFALAEACHADVRQDDRLVHVVPRIANDAGITLTAENMSLRELVQMSWTTQQPNVEIADGVDAKVAVFVANALWFDVLRAAAVAAGRQFVRTEHGYHIE